MIHYNPLLCLDFYKTAHAEQYPQTLTKMVSYYTPRMTRLDDTDKVTLFGLQAFIREYLINAFDENFFDVSWWDVLYEYKRALNATVNTDGVGEKRLKALPDLITSAKNEVADEQLKLKRVSDLITAYEKIVEGNYIDNLIRAQKEQEQSRTPDSPNLKKS